MRGAITIGATHIAVFLALLLVAVGAYWYAGARPAAVATTPGEELGAANCNTLSLDVNSFDYKKPGTAIGGAACTIFAPGGSVLTLAEGTAQNLPGFGQYVLHCTLTNYYDTVKTVTVNSCGAKVETILMPDIDTTRDSAYFNSDDGLVNAAGDIQAVGSGECVQMGVKFNGKESDGVWSNPQMDYSYVSYTGAGGYSAAAWDPSKWELWASGVKCTDVTGELGQISGEDVTFKCAGLRTSNYQVIPGTLTACAASGQDPDATNFTQTWTDADWYIDADTNTIGQGGDDAISGDVGGTDDTVTVFFT